MDLIEIEEAESSPPISDQVLVDDEDSSEEEEGESDEEQEGPQALKYLKFFDSSVPSRGLSSRSCRF